MQANTEGDGSADVGQAVTGQDPAKALLSFDERTLNIADAIAATEAYGLQWLGVFNALDLAAQDAANAMDPMPAWASEILIECRIGAFAGHAAMLLLVRSCLESAAGLPPDCVYEIWDRSGVRLDGQFVYAEHADAALRMHRESWPNAFIIQMNAGAAVVSDTARDALLPTLIGDIRYLGVRADRSTGGRLHAVQDSTGRTLTVTAESLRAPGILERLSVYGRNALAVTMN